MLFYASCSKTSCQRPLEEHEENNAWNDSQQGCRTLESDGHIVLCARHTFFTTPNVKVVKVLVIPAFTCNIFTF